MPDPNQLLSDAGCLTCLQPGQLDQIEVYLQSQWASADSTTLLEDARCFHCLTFSQLRLVRLYFLAVAAGGSLDANELLADAGCLSCLTPWQRRIVNISLLYQTINGSTIDDVNALLAEARCIACNQRGQLLQMSAYALAGQAGLGTDANEILSLASCLSCLLPGQMGLVETGLYSTILNGAPTDFCLLLEQGGELTLEQEGCLSLN